MLGDLVVVDVEEYRHQGWSLVNTIRSSGLVPCHDRNLTDTNVSVKQERLGRANFWQR